MRPFNILRGLIVQGSRRQRRTLRRRGLRKLTLNSGSTRRSAKNGRERPKNPSSPPYPAESEPVSLKAGWSTELNLRHLPRDPDDDLHNRTSSTLSEQCNCGTSVNPSTCRCTTTGVINLVQELQLWDLTGLMHSSTVGTRRWSTTEKSSTLSMNWIWGTSKFSYAVGLLELVAVITRTSTTGRHPPADPAPAHR